MLRSLYSAVSGVKAHQTYLDVTGNNIANVNTVGFKRDVIHFRDMIYQTSKNASQPNPSVPIGGVNPAQVGLGVTVGSIETVHTQGSLQNTGIPTDMAIQGSGYFVVKSGTQQLYTRAGNFSLDRDGNLVMQGNGYIVQGYAYKDVIDPATGNLTREKSPELTGVNIPIGEKIPAKATTLAAFRCNLCSTDTAEITDMTSIPGGSAKVPRPHDYVSYAGEEVTYISPNAPATAVEGETYYNTGDQKIYIYRNNAWEFNKDGAAETYYYGKNLAAGAEGQFTRIYSDGLITAPEVTNVMSPTSITALVTNAVQGQPSTYPTGSGPYLNTTDGKLYEVDSSNNWDEVTITSSAVYLYNDTTPANADKIYVSNGLPAPDNKLVEVDRVQQGTTVHVWDAGTSSFTALTQSGTASGPVVTARKIVDLASGSIAYDSSGTVVQSTLPDQTSDSSILAGATVLDTKTGKIFQLNSTRTAWTEIDPMQDEVAYGVRKGGQVFVKDSVGIPQQAARVMDISTGNKNVFEFTGGAWKSINDTQESPTALSPSDKSVTTQATMTAFGESMIKSSDWEDKFTVYDSRGNPYTMNIAFRKVMDRPADPTATPPVGAESEWDWYAYYTDSDGNVLPQYGQGAGTLVFGDDGLLKKTYTYTPEPLTPDPNGTNAPSAPQYAKWTVIEKIIDKNSPDYNASIHDSLPTGLVVADFNTAGAQGSVGSTQPLTYSSNTITLDFLGSDYAKTLGLTSDPIDGVTNYGSESTTKVRAQDGYAMGVLNDWTIGGDGVITGVYSNGRNLPIAQVALAMFANPQGLSKVGETCFAETINSGLAQVGAPQTNGAGSVQGNTIEMSNVDLSEEFVSLIRAQRGFQANTRVVTTSDQVLEELINMKR